MADNGQQPHERPADGSDFHRFARLVRLMRETQKEYFRSRSSAALGQSKDFERRVDLALRWLLGEVPDPPPHLPGLEVDTRDDGDVAGDVGRPGAYRDAQPRRRVPLRRRKP